MQIADKWVLITGAGSGVGMGFVKSFLKRGARLILCDINSETVNKVFDENCKDSARHMVYVADLSKEQERLALFNHLQNSKIEVEVLVNNAGIGYRSNLSDCPWPRLQNIIDLNVVATTHLTWLFLPAMKKRHSGGIINVSSTGAFCGADSASAYTGTKAYISNFTEGLSMELFDSGVTATSAHPGATDTNFWSASGWENSDYNKRIYLMPPEQAAEEFVCAFLRGSASVIAGTKNKLMVFVAKFLPREFLKRAAVRKYK